jgi:uncharacterized protein YjbJ (UPF0337 family)
LRAQLTIQIAIMVRQFTPTALASFRCDIEQKEHMKTSTKARAQGRARELEGKLKEKVGRATGNPRTESRGRVERMAGKLERKVGEQIRVLEE